MGTSESALAGRVWAVICVKASCIGGGPETSTILSGSCPRELLNGNDADGEFLFLMTNNLILFIDLISNPGEVYEIINGSIH